MVTSEQLLVGAAIVLAAASLPGGRRALLAGLLLFGGVGLAWAAMRHRGIAAGLGFGALATINLVRLLLGIPRRGIVRLSDEELAMAAHFAELPRAALRALLDQGLWIHGQPGEPLIREGQPVSHLFYLSEGAVTIASGGRHIADSEAGHFFGELDVFAGTPAIATITLSAPAHFWCIAADALRRFLTANPDYRAPLEAALAGELRAKLKLRNHQLIARETA